MLRQLKIADPQTHDWVEARLVQFKPDPPAGFVKLLEDRTIWALSLEHAFGQSVARGMLALGSAGAGGRLSTYCKLVETAAKTGVTLGRIMAEHLVPVLIKSPSLLDLFRQTVAVMQSKGTYTLNAPLDVLDQLLDGDDPVSATRYLRLLGATFALPLTYNRSLGLVYLLPKAVNAFHPRRRAFQIEQLQRAVETDARLADCFMEGMDKGLALLSAEGLNRFIGTALNIHQDAPEAAAAFLSLASSQGREACAALQVAVPLVQVRNRLSRYVAARLGKPISIEAMSAAPPMEGAGPWAASDGHTIYLCDEIEHFDTPEQNQALYSIMVRLEACFFEYGSFRLDLERLFDLFPEARSSTAHLQQPTDDEWNPERWFETFAVPAAAADLLNLYEQGRIMLGLREHYPGLVRRVLPVLRTEALRLWREAPYEHPLMIPYAELVLSFSDQPGFTAFKSLGRELIRGFRDCIDLHAPVEASAYLTQMTFDTLAWSLPKMKRSHYPLLATPFGWRLQWHTVAANHGKYNTVCNAIENRLAAHNLRIYRTDLQHWLARHDGQLSPDDLKALVLTRLESTRGVPEGIDWDGVDLASVIGAAGCRPDGQVIQNGPGCRYAEWDCRSRDYLHAYTRVQERRLEAEGDHEFYRKALVRHRGLLMHTRRAFELLKPEGLKMLRRWPEGDAFDYRALLDYAIDRRAGRIPSDRLFTKRMKQERDVAVLLLVDMSRSTANTVSAGALTVLDVAKEALVLFCEALEMVGDTYAIAGFSGTGRHAVDYFAIKDFQENLTPSVEDRISSMHPQRSTRMGAAIRHASAQLGRIPAAVRLIIIVSDGFPNDLGYKAEYAIADTRRAIQEARATGHHVKAISVNIGSDPRLDDLYGRYHYHVIENVIELPDKLIRMYGMLTKV